MEIEELKLRDEEVTMNEIVAMYVTKYFPWSKMEEHICYDANYLVPIVIKLLLKDAVKIHNLPKVLKYFSRK